MDRIWVWSLAKCLKGLGIVAVLLQLIISCAAGSRVDPYPILFGAAIFGVGLAAERLLRER